MKYARIADGRVAEVIELDGIELSEAFHPEIAATIVVAAPPVAEGWSYALGTFSPPQPPAPPTKAELIAYAGDARWRREVGGIIVAGVPVATDDRSKLMITGARVAAMVDPDWTTIWHGSDGGTYPVNAAAMVAISDEVQAHVNGSFATFATVQAEIEAGNITTMAEVEAAFEGAA